MMRFFLVDVSSITSNIPRSTFPPQLLERLADKILECHGLIRPLILKTVGLDQYVVIDGDLEYYAAVRAKEKDLRKAEMVNAMVISPKYENIIREQIKDLQGSTPIQAKPQTIHQVETVNTINLESRLVSLELQLETKVSELKQELTKVRSYLETTLSQEIKQLVAEKPLPTQIPQPSLLATHSNHYAGMTVSALKEAAKRRNLTYSSKVKKAELIAILEANDD